MRVNLPAQGVWDAFEHGDVEERKDRMALATIYQAMWETLQTMQVGVERFKEAKVQTLKSEFKAICMKNDESIDDIAMKLTTIINNIHTLGNVVEEISVIKKFLRLVLPRFMQIVTSIEQFSDIKNISVEEVVGRPKVCCFSIIGQGNPFFLVRGNRRQEVVGRKIKCLK